MYTLGLLVQAVAFSVLSAIVANNKGRSAGAWATIGFVFGLFGFIAAIAVGDGEGSSSSVSATTSTPVSGDTEFDPDGHEKKCPDCAEYIKLEARVCRYCGHSFSDEEVQQQVETKRAELEAETRERKGSASSTPAEVEGGGFVGLVVVGLVLVIVLGIVFIAALG